MNISLETIYPDVLGIVRNNIGLAIIATIAMAVGLIRLVVWAGILSWYAVVVGAAFIAGVLLGNVAYFYVFVLGTLAAFTEIIVKFSDEPIKTFKTQAALFYHMVNGIVAMFALYVLLLSGAPADTALERLKIVIVAGLGSILIMRSKLFDLKVGQTEIAFGPEQFVRVFLKFMEDAIDRVRAQARVEFVKRVLDNIDYEKVQPYCLAMLDAAQALEADKRQELEKRMKAIGEDSKNDKQLRSYQLGFAILNRMGEDYLTQLFRDPRPEWMIRAPVPRDSEGLLSKVVLGRKEELIPYFAFGRSMAIRRILERLGWSMEEARRAWEKNPPKPARLKGYRLVFAKAVGGGGNQDGLVTAVPDSTDTIEGVVYWLPPTATQFLGNAYEKGYRRVTVTLDVNGQALQAETYLSDVAEVVRPSKAYVELMVSGAQEHRLSEQYLERLRRIEVATPSNGHQRERDIDIVRETDAMPLLRKASRLDNLTPTSGDTVEPT